MGFEEVDEENDICAGVVVSSLGEANGCLDALEAIGRIG
eukprot:CAMPEP_0197300454 /NCGR_PEP_ID=MMETSP0890-20130614/48407_1 /TAXON_ID=44058 ORGANISM="Aureoumbra lagunensis, Strain CCMP1510" /NCGR_SAMPLE_ID=MMETSP0890 /ASSEMBLY_ACC=CAM_ASM_000533 /LENGTH=38 /DNA_ID= /DNA_START= /DNA_END= /DNA_ORIENTATION=